MSPSNTTMSIYTEPALLDGRSRRANAALQNPAVARCCQAWRRAYQEYAENDASEIGARGWACKAYRNAMPVLSGEKNIHDFMACVTHGLLIGAIQEERASKLLYAVQVALSMFGRDKKQKKPQETHPLPTPEGYISPVTSAESVKP